MRWNNQLDKIKDDLPKLVEKTALYLSDCLSHKILFKANYRNIFQIINTNYTNIESEYKKYLLFSKKSRSNKPRS